MIILPANHSAIVVKNLLIGVLFSICHSLSSEAQVQKGTTYLGATVTLNGWAVRPEILNQKSYGRYNHFAINPSFVMGKFFADNRVFGVGIGGPLGFGWGNSRDAAGTDDKSH